MCLFGAFHANDFVSVRFYFVDAMKRDNQDFTPYAPLGYSEEEMLERSKEFLDYMKKRRSVRDFSDRSVSREVLDNIIQAASTAPSGAHKQPWTFGVISNAELKHNIRELAEKEEFENYHGRMSETWLDDLKKFGTDHIKEFIDVAPYLIIVFKQVYELDKAGERHTNYYVNESVGIAVGFLLAAIHHAGLVALTHTPSPMNFLEKALNRPGNERAYLLIPVGHSAEEAQVPVLKRKPLDEIMFIH
ncbi:MAG: iodotyrosine deiodinase [Flavobacteriales bacterium]